MTEPRSLSEDADVRALAEALLAYANQYECPGFEIEPCVNSGCRADDVCGDCPTHAAVRTASRLTGRST